MRTKASPQNIDVRMKRRIERLKDLQQRIGDATFDAIRAKTENDFFAALNRLRDLRGVTRQENIASIGEWLVRMADQLSAHYRSVERVDPYGQLVVDRSGRTEIVSFWMSQIKERLERVLRSLEYTHTVRGPALAGDFDVVLRHLADARVLVKALKNRRGDPAMMARRIINSVDKARSTVLRHDGDFDGYGELWTDLMTQMRDTSRFATKLYTQATVVASTPGMVRIGGEYDKAIAYADNALRLSYNQVYTLKEVSNRAVRAGRQ